MYTYILGKFLYFIFLPTSKLIDLNKDRSKFKEPNIYSSYINISPLKYASNFKSLAHFKHF